MVRLFLATSLALTLSLLSLPAQGQPNERFPNHRALLKYEKAKLKSSAWLYTLLPLPFPLLSNIFAGRAAWKKYDQCCQVYSYFHFAHTFLDPHASPKAQRKAQGHLEQLLTSLQAEARQQQEELAAFGKKVQPEQAQLNERIAHWQAKDLADILARADRLIPPSCGRPEAAIAHRDPYQLRFKLRTFAASGEGLCALEQELGEEEAKLLARPSLAAHSDLLTHGNKK